MGTPDGGGVGFVQSVIDWKCKPESVQRPWGGSTEGERRCQGEGIGHQR